MDLIVFHFLFTMNSKRVPGFWGTWNPSKHPALYEFVGTGSQMIKVKSERRFAVIEYY